MATNGDVKIEDGILLKEVEVTTIELLPEQAALVMYEDGVTLALPNPSDDEGAEVPQHTLFLIGIYFMSEDEAFVERAIRVALDRLEKAKELMAEDEAKTKDQLDD